VTKPTDAEIEALEISFLNGNRSYVAQEIATMAPANAAYVTGRIVAGWMDGSGDDDARSLLRAILLRIED
jgi:hypothetical protein